MLRAVFILFLFSLFADATTLSELFKALKNHSQTKSDEMQIEKAGLGEDMAFSQLYPTVDIFAKYDHYTTATGMISVPPNELLPMVKDQSVAQPFSKDIIREGIKLTMPLFIKSIWTMADKAKMLQKSAKAKKRINLLKNEAFIVGADANLIYLVALENSLVTKEKSLKETQKIISIKVANGRAPASALYKIDDALNQINITKNSIKLQKEQVISTIRTLTGITLKSPTPLQNTSSLNTSGDIKSLEPMRLKIEADKLNVKAEKEKLYPTLAMYGSYTFSQAKAYNNDDSVDEDFGNIGVVLNIPLYPKEQYVKIEKAKVEMRSNIVELERLQDELQSKATRLKSSIPILENSIQLLQKSIENKEKLLKIAKVNYKSGRLTIEEYLRYEDEVVEAKAKLYKTEAEKWQTLMELAVIYGNNIEEIVR